VAPGLRLLLGKSCEGRFEVAIGSCIRNNEPQAQAAYRRKKVGDGGLGSRKRWVYENAKQARIGYQLAEQLQSLRRQFGRQDGNAGEVSRRAG
jgi:hypothetical protein